MTRRASRDKVPDPCLDRAQASVRRKIERGAFLTIVFVWMLHMHFVSQFLLGGITALFLGFMIFLIYSLDHPLRDGAISVAPDAFKTVWDQVMKWDE